MTSTDIAIVGGGIVGAMIATRLAEQYPEKSITVLERDLIGTGATTRSAGVHFPRGVSERVRFMAEQSQEYYLQLKAETGAPIFPVPMTLIASPEQQSQIELCYLAKAELTSIPREAPELAGISIPSDSMIWRVNNASFADVAALTAQLFKRLRNHISLFEGVRVNNISLGDDYCLTLSTGEKIRADKVVLAPGSWVNEPAWRHFLFDLPIKVKKIVAVHIEAPVSTTDGMTVFHNEDAFLLPRHDRGHWLFSYTCNEWDVDPGTISRSISEQDLTEARSILSRYMPEFAERISSGRVFCDAYSSNREPIVEALDGTGLIFAGGANGSGYRLAPAIAAQVVKLI